MRHGSPSGCLQLERSVDTRSPQGLVNVPYMNITQLLAGWWLTYPSEK